MMNLVTAVEQFYQDKPVPRLTLLILTDICTSAADGETVNGIARRLDIDVYQVRDVLDKHHELASDLHPLDE
jgi:energy-converting hydrogenase A subunit M